MNKRFIKWLCTPVSSVPLVVFRICFGLLVNYEIIHYWLQRSDINDFYIQPNFRFSYYGLTWFSQLDGALLEILFFIVFIAFFFIAIGFIYRSAAIVATIGLLIIFLSEASNFLNHWYLVIILTFFLSLVSANKRYALDVVLGISKKSKKIPKWQLYIFVLQIGLVWWFSGLAKIVPDWLNGQPMAIILGNFASEHPIFSKLFSTKWIILLFAYLIILVELLAFPFLLSKKKIFRLIIIFALIAFNLTNSYLFAIGTFPYIMILLLIFFIPLKKIDFSDDYKLSKVMIFVLFFHFSIQIILPLRHYLFKGNYQWTEHAMKGSWHMLTEFKRAEMFYVVKFKDTGQFEQVYVEDILTTSQQRKVYRNPDYVLQLAHYIGKEMYKKDSIEVYANFNVGLNGRENQLLVHPHVNLLEEKRQFLRPYRWVLPLKEKVSI